MPQSSDAAAASEIAVDWVETDNPLPVPAEHRLFLLHEAISKRPDDARLRGHLADTLITLTRFAEAVDIFETSERQHWRELAICRRAIAAVPGWLTLFPSHIFHDVVPTGMAEPRISVVSDLKPVLPITG